MRAVLYARKSNPDERNVGHQHERLRRACERAGWDVVGEFIDDGASGWKRDAKRPGFDAAVKAAASEGASYFVVTEVDRLTRTNRHAVVDLEDHGVRVVELDDDGDVRKLRWAEVYDKVGKARDESDVKSRRQLRAEDRRLQDGKPPRGGHRHFGYHLNCCPADDCPVPEAPVHRLRRGDHDKTNVCDACHGGCDPHTIREDEAAILREVAERWLAGEPMRALARELQERGIPTVRGGEWTRTGLRKTLMSPRLAGIRVHRRNGEVREVRLRDWTPVFPPDLHARLITADSSSGNRRAPQRYLLTGLLVCGQCDVTLNGKQHGPDRRRYTCLQCHRNGISAEPVDAAIWNLALGRSWHADRLDAARTQERLTEVETRIASDEARRAELDDAWADGDLPRERWARQVDRLDRRIKSMEDEARRLRADVRRTTRGWESLLALTETYRTADASTRRDVLDGVVRRIVLAPNRGRAGGKVDLSRLWVEWADGTVSDGAALAAMLTASAMEAPDAEEQRRIRQQDREEALDEIKRRLDAGEVPPVMPSKRGG